MSFPRRTLAAVGVALLMAACAAPGPQPLPARPLDPATLGATAGEAPWPAPDWWTAWADPGLDRLIATALARQPSLQTAAARLRRAQDAAQGVAAAGQPQVRASLDATDQRFSAHGLIPPPYAGTVQWTAGLQIGAAWSPDLFGERRAALEAAIGQTRAAEADAQAARVQLTGQVAAAHFRLAQLLDTRRVVQTALAQREQVLALVRERQGAGLDTAVELRQAEGQVAQARVESLALDEAIAQARHALAELTGQGPAALDDWAPSLVQARLAGLPDRLPADLLGRRADLVAARWRVEAAAQGVVQARARFYPSVDLSAFVGLSSLGLDQFLDLGSRTFGAGPAVHLPVFDGGLLRAQLGQRTAEADAAVAAYDATLLRALREVADALAGLRAVERQQREQAEAARAADDAYALALQRYRAGLGNYLLVLTAQSNVLVQQRAASELRGRRLSAEVALTLALGGGYQAAAPAAPASERAPA
jgi:NodT family efflux transporter outer membrane factor (OMF) lipoprotein